MLFFYHSGNDFKKSFFTKAILHFLNISKMCILYTHYDVFSEKNTSYCLWAHGSGSQCRPNWMHIGSGETQEGSGFWVGGYIGG